MARIAISTAYMCFRRASDSVYSWTRASASLRSMGECEYECECEPHSHFFRDLSSRERDFQHVVVQPDLERVSAGPRERHVEHQHRTGLHLGDAGGRLAELHRALAAHQLFPFVVDESNPDAMLAD